MCLAGAATWASHRWIRRWDVPHRLENGIHVKSLEKLLGLPPVNVGLPQYAVDPEDFETQPHYATFCQRVAQRAKFCVRDPSEIYEVEMIGMHVCQGFPLISRDWTARVEVFEENGKRHRFIAGQDGNSPILYGGLVGNWLFYLAVSAAMLYAAENAIITIIARRQRRRHGFPVVMVNEEET